MADNIFPTNITDMMIDVLDDMLRVVNGETDDPLVRYEFDDDTEEIINEKCDKASLRKFKKNLDKLTQLYELLETVK